MAQERHHLEAAAAGMVEAVAGGLIPEEMEFIMNLSC